MSRLDRQREQRESGMVNGDPKSYLVFHHLPGQSHAPRQSPVAGLPTGGAYKVGSLAQLQMT